MKALDVVQGVDTVASLPSVYQRLAEVINKPRSSASDIGKIVSEDPGLTARLLRLVNSAFFGFPSKIETVSRAIMIVGTDQLRDLSLATSVVQMFDKVPQDLVDMNSFWKHSLACGVVARVMAARRRESNVERFFVAGLLHDIGSIIMFMRIPEEMKKVLIRCKENKEQLHMVEDEILGFNHADVGRHLMESWNLPDSLREIVGCHHKVESALKFHVDTSMIHVADVVAYALKMGSGGEQTIPKLNAKAWEELKLPHTIIEGVIKEALTQFDDVVKVILSND